MATLDDATLVAFADGELDATTMRLVAELIACDPAAQDKLRQLRVSAELLRASFAAPALQAVPRGAAALVERHAAAPARAGRRAFTRSGLRWAAVAACVAGLAGGVVFSRGWFGEADFNRRLIDEVAEYHVTYARLQPSLDEVPADRRDQIAAWFSRILHGRVGVPEMARAGLAFRGARLLVIDGRPVAQLLYERPGQSAHPLGLCISAGEPPSPALSISRREGVTLASWGQRGFTYVLVGWADTAALTALAAALRPRIDAL